jgi:hypothetical protein
MKILVLCDEGNNRSVTLAHQLKYWGNDVIAAGVKRNSLETIGMLCNWADRVILTEASQLEYFNFNGIQADKVDVWDIGPDVYPRPFNKELLAIVQRMMQGHKAEYKHA